MIYRLLILATVSNLIMSCHSGNNSFSNGSVTQLAKVATDYSLHQDPLDVTDLGAGWFRIYCEVDWPQDRSRTEVETKLIRLAESEAILAATGTSLQQIITIFESTTGGLNFTEFLREVRSGHITDRRKPHWKLITPRRNSSRHIRLALEIDLKIEALAGHSDPGFFAELSLNRQSFEPGDKMEL